MNAPTATAPFNLDQEMNAFFNAVQDSDDTSGELAQDAIYAEFARLQAKADAYDRINTPEVDDFLSAVRNEALHQRERWGVDQDVGKEPADWFWLVGHLAGKALHDVKGKRLHHLITTAAALLNWHANATGHWAQMQPASTDAIDTVEGAAHA